ncbi:TIM barrel protein [Mitsuaria sp. WAJ17]|uniref:hydroxypyruvate isomerase family protein n=1 Tax=Mitsuaria sp. WAJ17 TaxID=2761452 RepID=UPI0015FF0497|nr:TIM barrel protein [Mitsuaria sp. WAJ17]MBB2486606.1 TIM barrel protein [Mitsuaria sp. WAJ17]
MPILAANLSFLYQELPASARWTAARADGFETCEILFPYAEPAAQLAVHLQTLGLQLALFNAPAGDWAAGDRGLACLPERREEFRTGLLQALDYAGATGTQRLHVMAGVPGEAITPEAAQDCWLEQLRWAAEQLGDDPMRLCVEPINPLDMPGYFLSSQTQAHALLDLLGDARVLLQFDAYHCQRSEGEVLNKLRLAWERGRLGHVQIAGAPDRHEPDRGELRVETLLQALDDWGYAGRVGCEYRPAAGTREGLAWARPWLRR